MTTTMLRVSEKTHKTVSALAREVGAPMQDIVEQAVEAFRRQHILEAANAAYAALLANPQAAQAWAEEQAAWEGTLADGLEP